MAYGTDNFPVDPLFDDLAMSLIGRRLFSTAGTVDYDYDENAISFSPNGDISSVNDRVVANREYPHAAKLGGKIYPHIHWEQVSTDDVIFTLQYRIQNNGSPKTTAWTTMTASAVNDSTFAYTSGTFNQITMFKDGSSNPYIDLTGIDISATIEIRLTRSDANAGAVLATFFDFHYEIDSMGSRKEYVK